MRKVLALNRLWMLLLLPVSLALIIISRNVRGFADWYASTVYPPISLIYNKISSVLPFSFFEIFIIVGILNLITVIVIFIVKFIKNKKDRAFRLAKFIISLAVTASAILFSFTVFAGINYARTPYSEANGMTTGKYSKEELFKLCEYLTDEINGIRPSVSQDENGIMMLSGSFKETAKKAAEYTNSKESEHFKGKYGAPKPLLFSHQISYTGITGIFSPFTLEANVNKDVPDYSIPATMCHELSHLRGYMREDEANFVAYIICRDSGDPDFRYSGAMLAFVHSINALYSSDRKAVQQIYSNLNEASLRDLRANSEYWDQFEGKIQEISNKANDIYLKANDQDDGVKSYGRMVDLLLADMKENKNNE